MLDFDVLQQDPKKPAQHILLVFHGLGSDKDNLKFLFDCWPSCGLEAWFFQAPKRVESFFGNELTPSWFSIPSLDEPDPGAFLMREEIIEQCAKLTESSRAQGARLHTAGFSQGGAMAVSVAHSLACDSVGLFSTFWPEYEFPVLKGAPHIFLSHGDSDDLVPIELGLQLMRYLQPYQPELCWVPGMAHAIESSVADDYATFLRQILLKS